MIPTLMKCNIAALLLLLLSLLILPDPSQAQTPDDLKKGVVRISAMVEGKRKVGTGFIVKLENDSASIVTASHVIEGDSQPQVEFFTQPNKLIPSTVIRLEGGNPKGLALLRVDQAIPSGLLALSLDSSFRIRGGEAITIIGFPRVVGTLWAVTQGNIAGASGRDVTFTGAADEGNSGGPIIKDARVIGVITEVSGQFGYAAPAATVVFALEGWGVKLAEVGAETESTTSKGSPLPSGKLLPTADQVLDKYVQALGGKAAFERIFSSVAVGTFQMPDAGIEGTVRIFGKAPDKLLFQMESQGLVVLQRGFNGSTGWERHSLTGLRDIGGTELAEVKRDSTFNPEIKLKELFPKRTVVGIEKVGGHETHVLEMTPHQGTQVTMYFDTQTGLLVRQIEYRESQGEGRTETNMEDYREVSGIKFPFTQSGSFSGLNMTVRFSEIRPNVPIDDVVFEKPAAQ